MLINGKDIHRDNLKTATKEELIEKLEYIYDVYNAYCECGRHVFDCNC